MIIRLTSLLLFFCTFAEGLRAESSVWEVKRGANRIYLGGTCHVLRESDLPLPAEFDQALKASAGVYFETDVARIQSPDTQQAILSEGMFTDGKTLQSVLSPAAWKAAQAYCAKAGLPVEAIELTKPWLFTIMIATLEIQKLGVSLEGVDLRLFNQATETHKKTGELEAFDTHLAFLTHLGAGHESEMVLSSIEEVNELPAMIDKILSAWKTGDLAKIEECMLRDMRAKYPAIYQELIVKRNTAWMPKIEAMLTTPEVEFVLVGAGHLAGKDGLITQLRAKGCTITQIKTLPAKK